MRRGWRGGRRYGTGGAAVWACPLQERRNSNKLLTREMAVPFLIVMQQRWVPVLPAFTEKVPISRFRFWNGFEIAMNTSKLMIICPKGWNSAELTRPTISIHCRLSRHSETEELEMQLKFKATAHVDEIYLPRSAPWWRRTAKPRNEES